MNENNSKDNNPGPGNPSLYANQLKSLMDFIGQNNLDTRKDLKQISKKIEQLNSSGMKKELCEAYREALSDKTEDLTEHLESLDKRVWGILGGIILSILLTIFSIACQT